MCEIIQENLRVSFIFFYIAKFSNQNFFVIVSAKYLAIKVHIILNINQYSYIISINKFLINWKLITSFLNKN